MLPDWVSNPGPLTYESGALPIALRGPALSALLRPHLFIFYKTAYCANMYLNSMSIIQKPEYLVFK